MRRGIAVVIVGLAALPVRAEEGSRDFDAAWAAATKRFPELARYRPLSDDPPPIDRLLAWAGPGGSTTVYDERCRPIRVARDGNALVGTKVSRVTLRGRRKTVEAYGVGYGVERSIDGPGTTTYHRAADGRWIEDGGSGCGCVEYPKGRLAKVTRDRAWYGPVVTLALSCGARSGVERPCADGTGSQTCTQCRGVGIRAGGDRFLSVGGGSATLGVVHASEPTDCSVACPPDDGMALIDRLNAALGDRRFLPPDPPLGRADLYRTLAACREDRNAGRNHLGKQ